nr:SpoIIE family protein phosphatase [Streptomyces minutiscleroticus]
MATASTPEASSRRFPPRPESVAQARHFARSALAGVAPDVLDTVELLVGELVTNAVIHARTEVDVEVWAAGDRVHARVGDLRPDHGPVRHPRHPYASTGRGLLLVEELASRHGVDLGEGRKTVWFELWPGAPVPPASVWDTVKPSGPTAAVTLTDVPYALYWAAQQHREAMLRELFLALPGDGGETRPQDLAVARDISHVINERMASAMAEETSSGSTLSLRLEFPADAAAAVTTLRLVLDEADTATQQESLLTLPPLPQVRAFRRWLLDQIAGQLSGGQATAWTLVPDTPSVTSTELAPWDAADTEASSVPTIVADDGNRIVAVNTSAARLLGWRVSELVGQRLTALIPEHLRERHVAAFTSLLLTGQPRILGHSIPLPALHRDGRLIPIRLRIQTQEAVDGRTVFVAQLIARTAASPPTRGSAGRRHARRPDPEPEQWQAAARSAEGAGPTGSGISAGEAARAVERLSLLVDTNSALTGTLNLEEALRRVCRLLTERLADWCAVELLDEKRRVERVCVVHRDPRVTVPGAYEGVPPAVSEAARGPLARVLRGAGPLLLTDLTSPWPSSDALDTWQRELFERLGGTNAVIAPLRARREVLGALTLVRGDDARPWTEEDLPLVADLVRTIALGVDNARLHQHTQRTAERFQRSLLPELPRGGHLRMAARYVPSSAATQVGGDWFDAFALPQGDTALVIGDVAGHDLQAAVAMSEVRNMLRGIAVDCQEPPAEVLRRLDVAAHTLHPTDPATATCIYALVKGAEHGPWELHHSTAGHLPILLTTQEGDSRFLSGGAGALIGMDPTVPRTTARDPLPPHSTLLLYTDGLVERRGESLDEGLDRLRRHTAALARAPLDVFCDELVIGLGADNVDDIALLALRPTPPA